LIESVKNFAFDSIVQVFETNIRVLGGLLSCHQILLNPKWNMTMENYENELLKLAIDLADRLLPAFTESTTELPYPRVIIIYQITL
jgi:mannosidase alpha-like ER degradation enhancer 1